MRSCKRWCEMNNEEPLGMLRRSPQVCSESFDECDVVFDTARGVVRRLNPTATQIWRALRVPLSLTDVVGATVSPPSRPEDVGGDQQASQDVVAFCDELRRWGLIETIELPR